MSREATARPTAHAAATRLPVAFADRGTFHVGGREVVVSGKPAREGQGAPGQLAGGGVTSSTPMPKQPCALIRNAVSSRHAPWLTRMT